MSGSGVSTRDGPTRPISAQNSPRLGSATLAMKSSGRVHRSADAPVRPGTPSLAGPLTSQGNRKLGHLPASGQCPQEEQKVGRTLGKTSGEVAVPVRAVGHIHPHKNPLLMQPGLLIGPNAIQHLDLV